jgi:diacylglycerol kinase (ATP)
MRAIVILNPASGASTLAAEQGNAGQHEERIVEGLHAQNIELEVRYTTPEDPGNGLAKQATEEEDADVVIAAGGDGTIHAVATGLIGTRGTLGIIPTGTMNNIARSLHIPEDIDAACKIIACGQTKRMDVGKVNGQVFLEVSGAGLEAALFPAAEEIKSQGLLSSLRGIVGGLDTLLSYRPTRFRISFDERRSRSYHAMQVSICNTPYYGARLQFAPGALMDDGLLDVLIYKNFNKLEYLRHAFSISQGRRALLPKVVRRKAKLIRITADTPVEVHADGVSQGITPATIEVVAGVLQVRVPEQVADGPNMSDTEKRHTRHSERARSGELFKENELKRKEPDEDTKEKGALDVR